MKKLIVSIAEFICWFLQAPVMPLFRAVFQSCGKPTFALSMWVTFYGTLLWLAASVIAYGLFVFLYDVLGV